MIYGRELLRTLIKIRGRMVCRGFFLYGKQIVFLKIYHIFHRNKMHERIVKSEDIIRKS